MAAELTEMVGAQAYQMLCGYLEERRERTVRGVPLPHPALRRGAPS